MVIPGNTTRVLADRVGAFTVRAYPQGVSRGSGRALDGRHRLQAESPQRPVRRGSRPAVTACGPLRGGGPYAFDRDGTQVPTRNCIVTEQSGTPPVAVAGRTGAVLRRHVTSGAPEACRFT
ncbi:hypothetical protein GCM10018793_26860 [Streptomyces sulfonofaciens]|uniref:Uncharacterized protein n=1 Tax=Streptomyces sulfonofaciens TaxID=68272 RepID=A0A919KZH4_9ACTN|nr:hypothetical protein GCM10018793_26860 [Streptomyces sulfonofaciens]